MAQLPGWMWMASGIIISIFSAIVAWVQKVEKMLSLF